MQHCVRWYLNVLLISNRSRHQRSAVALTSLCIAGLMHICKPFEELYGNPQDGVGLEMFVGLIIIANNIVDTGAQQLEHETQVAAVGSCVYELVEQTDDMICSILDLQRTQRLRLPRMTRTVGSQDLEANPPLLPVTYTATSVNVRMAANW